MHQRPLRRPGIDGHRNGELSQKGERAYAFTYPKRKSAKQKQRASLQHVFFLSPSCHSFVEPVLTLFEAARDISITSLSTRIVLWRR
jgi:hypothetical protein